MGRGAGQTGRHSAHRRGHHPHRRRHGISRQLPCHRRPASHTYVIAVSYLAPDERPDLAADDRLSRADVDAIATRLDRWDNAAETPWTRKYLEMIRDNEAVRAPDLAARVGL